MQLHRLYRLLPVSPPLSSCGQRALWRCVAAAAAFEASLAACKRLPLQFARSPTKTTPFPDPVCTLCQRAKIDKKSGDMFMSVKVLSHNVEAVSRGNWTRSCDLEDVSRLIRKAS